MSYPGFEDALRRVITGDDGTGQSVIVVDGPPSVVMAEAGLGGLFEIWADAVAAPLDPRDRTDRGPSGAPVLSPERDGMKVRWFIIEPPPPGAPKAALDAAARAAFARMGAADHLQDQTRHHAMHETQTLDVICLLKGDASLILENGETRLRPGQVVIQRGTNHAWAAHGGPALFLAVLIDRPIGPRS
jgi:hypothetical protein